MNKALLNALLCVFALSAHAATVTITAGGTYSGYNINNDGTSADCIDIATTAPVVITNSTLTCGSGIAINNTVSGTNITVKLCAISCTGKSGACINIASPASLVVKRCSLNGTPHAAGDTAGDGVIVAGNGTPTTAVIDVQQNYIYDCNHGVWIQYVHADPNVTIAYNQISMTSLYAHRDQIAIYQSWGTGTSLINIAQNFVAVNPEQVAYYSNGQYDQVGGINACDINSTNVLVNGNTVLNGGAYGIGFGYPSSGGVSQATQNIVVGVGGSNLPAGFPFFGFGAVVGSGPDTEVYNGNGNYVIFYQKNSVYYSTYWPYIVAPGYAGGGTYPSSYPSGDVQWPWSQCSLAEEQSLYAQWQQQMSAAGILVGTGANPGITYPQSSDFP